MICARLGATFFFVSVLLVGEGDGDETDVSIEVFVEQRDDGAPRITAAKDNVADCQEFCFSSVVDGDVFAAAHGKEKYCRC